MKRRELILCAAIFVFSSFISAFATTTNSADRIAEVEASIDDFSYDELVELRDYINNQISVEAKEDFFTNTDNSGKTLAELFEDEAIAMYVRDKLGKYTIDQPVTQDELDTITEVAFFNKTDYGAITSLKGISCLRNLESLCIFNGCAEPLKELPEEIFTLTSLKRISVPRAAITTIPDNIGLLGALEDLDFSGTKISSLPNTFSSLTALRKLDISNTSITEFPEVLYSLTLEDINMSGLPIK